MARKWLKWLMLVGKSTILRNHPVSPDRVVRGRSGTGHYPDMLRSFGRRTEEVLSEAHEQED